MPMFACFQKDADLTPYVCKPAGVDLEEKNLKTAYGAAASAKMDLTKEDAIDDLRFNEIIWRNVRGAESRMPRPVRAAFVFPKKKAGDDDDDE
jgi:hypothetical protein